MQKLLTPIAVHLVDIWIHPWAWLMYHVMHQFNYAIWQLFERNSYNITSITINFAYIYLY